MENGLAVLTISPQNHVYLDGFRIFDLFRKDGRFVMVLKNRNGVHTLDVKQLLELIERLMP